MDDILVKMRRPNGTEVMVRVPPEHLDRLLSLANGEFGDKSIVLDGPEIPVQGKK